MFVGKSIHPAHRVVQALNPALPGARLNDMGVAIDQLCRAA